MQDTIRAGCKVNLHLDIVGVRPDGYHEIESLFYPLPEPYDILSLDEDGGEGVRLTCSEPALATADNILVRAHELYARVTGFSPGLKLHLTKGIPMGAGLGGGSSDAAALLSWLNARAGARAIGQDRLAAVALALGADVPFFLYGRPAWVTGVGELLQPVSCDLSGYWVLVVCPAVRVSTAWAYSRWDAARAEGLLRSRKGLTPTNSPIMDFCFAKPPVFWNAFEEVVFHEFPALYEVKEQIRECGAQACVMSGSGSSFVALFASVADAHRCVLALRSRGLGCHGPMPGGQAEMVS